MADWGYWEWLGYAPIFLTALILAAAGGVGLAPSLQRFKPKIFEINGWRFLPLALLLISTFAFFIGRSYFGNPDPARLIMSWEPLGRTHMETEVDKTYKVVGSGSSEIEVRGGLLSKFSRDRYKMIGVYFFHNPYGDILDSPDISKSGAYDISDENVSLIIPWNNSFIKQMMRGSHPTEYSLLIVPISIDSTQFSTLRQAHALGIKEVAGRAGPP